MTTEPIRPASMSVRRSITIASLIMMTSVFLSRVLGLVREMVLASYGGTHAEMDAYVAAFLIPELINHLLAGGFMSVTFIPIFQRHVSEGRPERAWRVFSNLLVVGTIVLSVLLGVCMVFTNEFLGLMGRQITDPAQLALTTRMTRIVLPGQLFFYWGALLMAVQYAGKRFLVPALAPLVYNVGIIAGGAALYPSLGIEGFAWGVLAGSFAGNFVLQVIGARSSGMAFRPVMDIRDPDLVKYVIVTIPLVVGLGMQFSNEVFFRFFGSFLGEGGLASLNYSLRTMMAMVAVFGQAFGVASFPYLAQYVIDKRFADMNALLFGMVTKVAAVMIPLSLLMMILATDVIGLLFQHNRFNAASTAQTAPVLAMYCIGAFGFAANSMVSRGFYAVQSTVLPMIVSTAAALFSLPLYWLLLGSMGPGGIAFVGSLAMVAQVIVLTALWTRRYQGWKELNAFLTVLVKVTVISAAGCALCFGIAHVVGQALPADRLVPKVRYAAIIACGGTPAILLVLIGLQMLRVVDVRATVAGIFKRQG